MELDNVNNHLSEVLGTELSCFMENRNYKKCISELYVPFIVESLLWDFPSELLKDDFVTTWKNVYLLRFFPAWKLSLLLSWAITKLFLDT